MAEFEYEYEEEFGGRSEADVIYICINCGKRFTYEQLKNSSIGFVCDSCSSRIFIKPRSSGFMGRPRKVWAI